MEQATGVYRAVSLVLLLAGSVVQAVEPEEQTCISWQRLLDDDDQTTLAAHLNNKRPYPNNKQVIFPPEDCSIVHTLYIGRHGSRYVTKAEKLTRLLEELNALLETETSEHSLLTEAGRALQQNIEQLSLSVNESGAAGSITETGREELERIARRLASGTGLAPAPAGSQWSYCGYDQRFAQDKTKFKCFHDRLKALEPG